MHDRPLATWDDENECWVIRSGDIIIQFLEPGELIVAGHDVTAQVSYDQITEDRGLRFQDRNSRWLQDSERKL
jgi:hypothetical protein